MSNFYIVPPRLIVGSLLGNNYVTSLNGLRGDITISNESPITLLKQFNNVILGFDSTGFITTAGGTITGNLRFNVSSSTTYGVQLLSKTIDPTGTPPTGAIYYNTATQTLRIYDGGWTDYTGTGPSTNYDTFYLRLDGSNQPVTGYVNFTEYVRVANKNGIQASFGSSYGSIYYDTNVNKLRVWTPSGWQLVGGSGVTALYSGTGISFINTSTINDYGTITVDENYNFNWTGSQTFTQPINFATNQTFDITKLNITSQTAGDVIYFNGTNWTRLGIGSTGQVLTVATGATKPQWSNAGAGGGSSVIGTPTDTTYSDGYFNTWSPTTTTISDAFDDINELLVALAPAQPGNFDNFDLDLIDGPQFFDAKISSSLNAIGNWYEGGYVAGDLITKYNVSGEITLRSPNILTRFLAGKANTPSTYGAVSHMVYYESYPAGLGYSSIDLADVPSIPHIHGNLAITDLSVYNTIWEKANAEIFEWFQLFEGYAGHTLKYDPIGGIGTTAETNLYEVWHDEYSASNPYPSFATAPTNAIVTEVFKWLSGIKYYTISSEFNLSFIAASGIFNRCYHPDYVARISSTGLNTIDLNGEDSGIPAYNSTYDRSSPNHVSVVIDKNSESSFDRNLYATLYKPTGLTAVGSTALSHYINTYNAPSTEQVEYFQDEDFRLEIDSAGYGTAWDSQSNLANGELQVRSGYLRVPVQADYTEQYIGAANTYNATSYEYQRYFVKTGTTQSGTLTFVGVNKNDLFAYGTSGTGNTGVNCLIYFEDQDVWFDLAVPFGTSGRDGTSKSLAFGAQDVGNTNGSVFAWTSGSLYSTGLNNSRFRLSVTLRGNSTKTITRVTSA
jgi:hypothetical protein